MDDTDNEIEGQDEDNPSLGEMIESTNIAEKLDEDDLKEIGRDCKAGFDTDMESRHEWDLCIDEWTKLAKLTAEVKMFPWPKASNVKYPLLSTAAMQFAARAYPSLVPSDGKVVSTKVVGKDQDGSKADIAEAVSIYMSYQLLDEMDGWEEDMDKLLIMLPVVGTMFKKTYWDPIKQVNCSKLILPKNLVVDYWTKNLRDSERISEVLTLNPRIVKERQQAKLWLDVDLPSAHTSESEDIKNGPSTDDDTTPHVFIEQHTYLDLDEDGYKEPYIITFHKETSTVVRIVARFDEKTMIHDKDGKLIRIEPIQYYTKFGFVPNPDGSFYDIGFGILLGPINESVNTLINQLIDAGTLNNLQSGFIGKGLRLRMGETKFNPGEWKVVNSTGDDLKKQIVPLPSKEPSDVLFKLMTALIQSGKELASVAEIFTGKMPGQNTPATTTMATVEQGMKVFTAVYKRIYRSLAEEFKKLYRLNGIYLNPNTEVETTGMTLNPENFQGQDHRIIPGADPQAISQTEKLMKAEGLMQMLGAGLPLDPVKVMMRMLQAQEQPNWQELIPQQIMQSGQMPPKPPDPKVQALQAKSQADIQASQQQMAIKQQEAQLNSQSQQQDLQYKQAESQINLAQLQREHNLKLAAQVSQVQSKMSQAEQEHVQALVMNQQEHQQSMQHNAQQNAAKVEAVKQQAKAKPTKGEK